MPKSSLRCHIDGIHQTLVSHRASHQSFISLETAVCSSFIFHKSPVNIYIHKTLAGGGFLLGHGSLASPGSTARPSALALGVELALLLPACRVSCAGLAALHIPHSLGIQSCQTPNNTPKFCSPGELGELEAQSAALGLHPGLAGLQIWELIPLSAT